MADYSGGLLVFALSAELSRSGRNGQGTWLRGGSQQYQSLGFGLCPDDGEAVAPVPETALWFYPRR